MELLESRCMLSLAPLATGLLPPSDTIETISSPVLSNRESLEYSLPELDLVLPSDSEPWIPLPTLPTNPFEPADPGLEPGIPSLPGELPDDYKPADPSDDAGGPIELEGFGKEDDGSPAQAPASGVDEREGQAVLDLLTSLQYPSLAAKHSTASADASITLAFDRALETALWTDEQFFDLRPEITPGKQGLVQLVSGDDEFATSQATPQRGDLLDEVMIEIDNSSGRLLVFEVLAAEESFSRGEANARPVETDSNKQSRQDVQHGDSAERSSPLEHQEAIGETEVSRQANGSGSAIDAARLSSHDGDQTSSSWPLSVSIIALGLVIKLLRERRFHRWQLRTRVAWRMFTRQRAWAFRPAHRALPAQSS